MSLHYLKISSWSTLCYTASGVLSKVLSFIMLPYFLSKVSLSEFGIWDWYHSWSVSVVCLGSGLSIAALPRFVALYNNKQQKNAISNALYAGLIAMGVVVIVALIVLPKYYSDYKAYSFGIICLSIPFNIVLSYCSSLQYIWCYNIICLLHNTITAVLTALLLFKGYGTQSFFLAHYISLSLFFPFFIRLIYIYSTPSRTIAYQQICYSLPIVTHGFIYTLFCLIDRIALRTWCSATDLGSYALLIRFATMFHIVALSISNVWPALCFEAHQDQKTKHQVADLINYCSFFLWIGYFGTCIATALSAQLLFKKYIFIVAYMPLFLIGPLLLSLAQLYTVGASISKCTLYLPFLSALTAGIQYLLLYLLKPAHLVGLVVINCIPFLLYAFTNAFMSKYYATHSINNKKLLILHIISLIFSLLIYVLFVHLCSIITITFFVIMWVTIVIVFLFKQETRLLYNSLYSFCLKRT